MTPLRVAVVRQTRNACAPATMRMALARYRVHVPERELKRGMRWNRRDGVWDSKQMLNALPPGMAGWKMDPSSLHDIAAQLRLHRSVMVNWMKGRLGHLSLVVHLDRQNIYLADPEERKIVGMQRGEFVQRWMGVRGNVIRSPKDIVRRRMLVVYPIPKK